MLGFALFSLVIGSAVAFLFLAGSTLQLHSAGVLTFFSISLGLDLRERALCLGLWTSQVCHVDVASFSIPYGQA